LRLILVRHGETSWNKERRVQGGDSDIGLNETGFEQARKLGAFLKKENVIAIHASPMQRAIATAEAIAKHHRLPVEVDQELREIGVGELEGMSLPNLGTTFSQFLMQWWQQRGARESPDGETLVELQQRTWKVIEGLVRRHEASHGHNDQIAVVVVSHFFVTLAIILKALDLPPDCFTKFRVDLGGVSILEFNDYGTRLLTFNDTSY
jgi:broad specificity phosphatase PhoE